MKQTLLIIPGLGDSGPDHWHSYWLKKFNNSHKVVQKNWDEPLLAVWLEALQESVRSVNNDIILVAHSLGVALVMHWSVLHYNPKIKGAMLVSPSDVDSPDHTPPEVRNFAPMPLLKLAYPSIVVASENDPYVGYEHSKFFARKWGSDFAGVGRKGHINSDSKLEYWEEGQKILNKLIEKIM